MDLINSDITIILKSILVTRAKTGALIEEIINDYKDFVGTGIDKYELRKYLGKVDGVYFIYDRYNRPRYHVETAYSKHIIEMVKQQKPESQSIRRNQKMYTSSKPNNFKRSIPYNYNNTQRKQTSASAKHISFTPGNDNYYYQNNQINNNNNIKYKGAYLHNFQLVGDDFFLQMAVQELGVKLTPGHRVQQAGLCISGQTISDLTHRIKYSHDLDENIIINIGSVDILHGRELLDIVSDFIDLIQTFHRRGITPIITTIPPLANLLYSSESKIKLWKFNQFIRNSQKYIIDLYVCMVDNNDNVLSPCYQPEAKYVTGSCQPHVLWNKLGRQRILKLIKKQLTELLDY